MGRSTMEAMTWTPKDQEQANKEAWEDLKARFYKNCPNQEKWNVDEDHHTISTTDGTTGVTSCSYPFWRNIKPVTWTQR